MLGTQPYKGTRDFYPEDQRIQSWMFERLGQVARSFGYEEYNGPMLEPFELYAAKTGEEIVNQQLYWMMDKGERKLAVRPEMTPTLARMVAGKIHELPKPIRWYSLPNLWRYERPQRGRLREHWQLNVDVLGGDPLLADAKILNLGIATLRAFGGEKLVALKVNNRRLIDHVFAQAFGMPAEVALQATKAIDARGKIGDEAYRKWLGELGLSTKVQDELDGFFKSSLAEIARKYPCPGVEDLEKLFALCQDSGIGSQVHFDPTVLRGMDYYTGTVFELYDTSPDNHRAMFGGGRYDNLVGLFGKHTLSGVGFGMGDVTLRNFLETHGLLPQLPGGADVFVTLPELAVRGKAEALARDLRQAGLRVVMALEASGFGAQLKLAAKQNTPFVALLGQEELARGEIAIKDLRSGQQVSVKLSAAASHIQKHLASQPTS
jgi:histidyl-tRNA synthetase